MRLRWPACNIPARAPRLIGANMPYSPSWPRRRFWAREIGKLGHIVKLMPPKYVEAYVKRGKTDAGNGVAAVDDGCCTAAEACGEDVR